MQDLGCAQLRDEGSSQTNQGVERRMKVYVDASEGDEWFIGPSARQISAWLKIEQEIDISPDDLRELTDEEMQTLKFVDEDDGTETTFAEHRRELLKREGQTFPDFFASGNV